MTGGSGNMGRISGASGMGGGIQVPGSGMTQEQVQGMLTIGTNVMMVMENMRQSLEVMAMHLSILTKIADTMGAIDILEIDGERIVVDPGVTEEEYLAERAEQQAEFEKAQEEAQQASGDEGE